MNRNLSRLGFTALALVAGQVLFAQDATTGAVFGTVKNNKSMAILEARIILDGGRGQMEYTTDVSGQFRITGLIPGKYTITVVAPGYEKMLKQTINVGVNQRTPINVVLTAAAAATVEVVASAGQIDATTVTTGAQFSTETFSALPLGRSFTSVAAMAPGVVSSGIDSSNPSIGGGSGLENQYVIDGANTTNPGYGSAGSFSGTYGSMGSGINTDFIQEVQVKSFAMEAEYGQTTGGIVNAITKSGSNTFEGSAFLYLDIDSLNARNRVPVLSGVPSPTFDSTNRTELGFTASGPIIKDKLFYFAGYNPIQEDTKRTAPFKNDGTSYPLSGQQFTERRVTNSYYAKLQWQLNTSHLLEFSTFGDPGERKNGPQAPGDYRGTEGKFSKLTFGASTYTLKYNGIFFNDFLVEARLSSVENNFKREISALGNSEWQVRDSANANADIQLNGVGLFESKVDGKNTQMEFKLTKTVGIVDFRAGYLHEDVSFDASNAQRSGPIGFSDPHAPGTVFQTGLRIQKRFYLPGAATGVLATDRANAIPYYRIERGNTTPPLVSTKTKYDAYFIQGNAKLGNFNLKAGVRWEQQELQGEALTYTFKASDNMAPRIGLTWDIEGNGKSKLYAFWGRYFEKVPNDIAVRALSTEKGVNRSDFRTLTGFTGLSNPILDSENINDFNWGSGAVTVVGPGAATDADKVHFATTGSDPTRILPGTKSMYQDEMVLGYDSETSFGMTYSNRFIYRKLGRILEDLSLDGDSYFIGNPGQNEATIRDLTGYTGAATFPAPTRNYWAFELEARKATSKYSAFMNLRFSKLEGNYEGLYRGDNGQQDPNISSLYDLPVEAMADAGRGLTGREQFLIGSLPTDRTVVANIGFSYVLDMGLSLGVLSRIQTGTPITSYLAHPVYGNAGEIPQYGRGSEGRLPTTYSFDTTTAYTLKLKGKMALTFRADIFNLFNAQKITALNTNLDVGKGTTNPNYMLPLAIGGYETGRRVRLGVKFAF